MFADDSEAMDEMKAWKPAKEELTVDRSDETGTLMINSNVCVLLQQLHANMKT